MEVQQENSIEEKRSVHWKQALILSLFTLSLLALISVYYHSQKNNIFAEQKENLSSIAILKLKQIELWRQERIGDATLIRDNQPLIEFLHDYFGKNTKLSEPDLQRWMASIHGQYDYSDVLLIDTASNIKMSLSKSDAIFKVELKNELKVMLSDHSIHLSDLKYNAQTDSVYLAMLIPLIVKDKDKPQFFGTMVLRINPSKTLFPLIKLWPTSSKSSETLLLRREGDSVLFLNELRHKSKTALRLRLPLSRESLLATKAVRGETGYAEGTDYRNIPVIGYISEVPQFHWFMVAKTDKAELLEPVHKYFIDTLLISLLILIINTVLFLNWSRNQLLKSNLKKLANETKARKAEQQLLESEKLFRNLFENMLNGFAYCKMIHGGGEELDFLYLNVNKSFGALTGLKDVEGKRASEVIPGIQKSDQDLLQRYLRVAVTGKSDTFETYVESMQMWFLISLYSPEKDYFVAVFDTITERKNVETSLQESEDKFKYVFDYSIIGKSITTPDGKIQVNKAFCDMMGYSAEELSGKTWEDITHPDDMAITQAAAKSLLSGEAESMRFSKRYIRKDGSIIWVNVSTALRHDKNGKPLYFMTAINDITEQKLAEEVLRNDEKRLRDIIESLPQLFWTCKPEGPCDYLSSQWIEFTGISEPEQLGYGWLDQVHPEDKDKVVSEWNENVKNGETFDIEFRIRRHDGEYHWFQTRAVPIKNSENIIVKWLGSNTDIDSIRRAEAQLINYNRNLEQSVIERTTQLEAANRELEAFSYSVSHDLRAPLRAVHGFTKILKEDYDKVLDDEGRRICEVISSSATQMSELIDDLLSFSRIGRSTLNPSLLNMGAMAKSAAEELVNQQDGKNIKFSIGELNESYGDPNLLRNVWNNLISNAIKYSSKQKSPKISIASRKDGDSFIYEVKDNGVGFDMLYANKLFGVFQRLHSETEFEGNGVGLAIVQRIINRHGGKIWAEAEIGKGATFSFSIPANGAVKNEQ